MLFCFELWGNTNLTFPIFNEKGVKKFKEVFHNYVERNDTFLIISGNSDNPLSFENLTKWSSDIRMQFPDNQIFWGTAGLKHFNELTQSMTYEIAVSISGLTYIYEPGNEFLDSTPEFRQTHDVNIVNWTELNAFLNFNNARSQAAQLNLEFSVKPTGRPLCQSYLWNTEHNGEWNFGRLSMAADQLWIQTQTFVKRGDFYRCIERLNSQLGHFNKKAKVQISINSNDTNSVSVNQALRAIRQIEDFENINGAMIWWGTDSPEKMLEFLSKYRGLEKQLI